MPGNEEHILEEQEAASLETLTEPSTDGTIDLTVSKDEMPVNASFYPPTGNGHPLTLDPIREMLTGSSTSSKKNIRLDHLVRSILPHMEGRITSAAEYRDEATGAHVKRISHFTSALARAMGMDSEFVESIFYASPMHDIGKIGIPDSILLKPGPLTPTKWEIIRTHPSLGRNILGQRTSPYVQMGAL